MIRPGKLAAAALTLLVALAAGSPAFADDKEGVPLKERVADLEKAVQDLRAQLATQSAASDLEMRLLTARLKRIEASLETRAARRSFNINPNAASASGTIRLRNNMAVTATVTINGESYRIRPGAVRTIDQSAGPIRYYVSAPGMSEGNMVRSEVNANETLTIRILDPREE